MGSADSTLLSEEVEEIRAELPQCLLLIDDSVSFHGSDR